MKLVNINNKAFCLLFDAKEKMSAKEKKKYLQSFRPEWSQKYSFISEIKTDPQSANCKYCNKTINIGKTGLTAISLHIKSDYHRKNAESAQCSTKISSMFQKSNDLDISVIRAETKMTALLIENDIPFSFADKISDAIKDIFPDSEIAKRYSCKRVKTGNILNLALKPHFQSSLITRFVRINENYDLVIFSI